MPQAFVNVVILSGCKKPYPTLSVKSHSQLKLIGLRGLLMPSSEHPGYRDSDRFSGPA